MIIHSPAARELADHDCGESSLERAKPWRMARHALVGCGAIGLVGNTAIFTFNGGQLNGVTFTPGNVSAYVSFPLWSLMLLGGISYNEKLRTAAKFVASSLSLSQIGDRELSAFAQAQPAELHDGFKEGDHHNEIHDASAGEVVACAALADGRVAVSRATTQGAARRSLNHSKKCGCR